MAAPLPHQVSRPEPSAYYTEQLLAGNVVPLFEDTELVISFDENQCFTVSLQDGAGHNLMRLHKLHVDISQTYHILGLNTLFDAPVAYPAAGGIVLRNRHG
jgi:hypothetical protein